MRKASLLACALLFLSVAGFAQTPGGPALTEEELAAILGQPAAAGSCGSQQADMAFAAKGPRLPEKSTCTANCLQGGTVTCSGTNCSASNGICASSGVGGHNGSVTCDGTLACLWLPEHLQPLQHLSIGLHLVLPMLGPHRFLLPGELLDGHTPRPPRLPLHPSVRAPAVWARTGSEGRG